jgi:hypothetical protein
VLWIDEIEKGVAGMGSSDQTDGGTTARVVGTLLTWMQEKREPVFVVATANRIDMLPPELLRKGRFDELFFVDLPSASVRKDILRIHLEKKKRAPKDYDLDQLAALSVGFSGAEIEEAVTTARDAGCKEIILLHCISSYPAPMDQANLLQIPKLGNRFKTLVGLSDHTMGTTASITAVALGACLIEKHFTLSRSDKGPDSEFSLEPAELDQLCHDAKSAWMALGKTGYKRQVAEEGSKVFRRSLYFVKNLQAGHVIGPEDIRRIRPGMGLAPKYFDVVVGRVLAEDVMRGDAVSFRSFK